MKKFFLALFFLVLLLAGATFVILRFWPNTKAGEYAARGWERTKSGYDAVVALCTGKRHNVPPAEEPQAVESPQVVEPPKAVEPPRVAKQTKVAKPAPVDEPTRDEEEPPFEDPVGPEEEAMSAEPPAPAVDLSKPWKGLEPENRYCGRELSEKSLDGKIVMVYGFSETDEDSIALLPRIERVWAAYKTKPFVVLGSHRGGKSAKVASILKKAKVTFPVYEDAGRTKEPNTGGEYPIVYVVDDTGRIVYRGRSDLEATEAVVTAIPEIGKRRKRTK